MPTTRGIHRPVLHARRHARRAAADDQHGLADAGIDGIDGDEVVAFGFALGIDRAGQQQLAADQPRIFPRRDDGADDSGEKHGAALRLLRLLRPSPSRSPCRSAGRLRGWRAAAE